MRNSMPSSSVELALVTPKNNRPTIRHLHFFADNDAAVGRVTEQSNKKGRSHAENFWRAILIFLGADPTHTQSKFRGSLVTKMSTETSVWTKQQNEARNRPRSQSHAALPIVTA